MRTVFVFVDKPTFIGDLLRTQYINYLATKFRVVVFTKKLDSEIARQKGYFQSPNVVYVRWQPEHDSLLGRMKLIRYSCIREFDGLATMKHYRKRRGEDGEKSLLRQLSRPLAFLLTSKFFNKLELLLIGRSKKFADYCAKYSPELLVTATPGLNNFEAEGILLAKKFNIPSVAADCGWDNLTTRATRVRPADYFFAWHEPMKKEAIEIHGWPKEKVFLPGPLRFDYYFVDSGKEPSREEFLKSKNLDPNLKTILYSTQKAHLFEEEFIRKLIDLREKKSIPHTNILIRVHPLAAPTRFQEFVGLANVCVERPDSIMESADLLNLKSSLRHTDLNVNYSSTISLEAIAFDKPVINYFEKSLGSFEHNHYKPLLDMKALKLVYDTKDELAKAIRDYLEDPSIDREARNKVLNIYFPFRDGLCYKRNIDFLEEIANYGNKKD